jgi:DNA-binding transcriptional LysR family regulator
VYDAVKTDQADLGLVSYPKTARDIDVIPWIEEPMVLVCTPTHRFAEAGCLPIEALDDAKMVGFDRELTIRREIDRVLHQHNVSVEMTMEFDNIETIKRAVEIEAGVALLPAPTVSSRVRRGTLVAIPLESDELVRPLGIIYRRGKELGTTTRRFVDLLTAGEICDGEVDLEMRVEESSQPSEESLLSR